MITIAATDIFYTQNRPSKFSFSLLFLGLFLYFFISRVFMCGYRCSYRLFSTHTKYTQVKNYHNFMNIKYIIPFVCVTKTAVVQQILTNCTTNPSNSKLNPLTPTVAIGTAIKHPVPDRLG